MVVIIPTPFSVYTKIASKEEELNQVVAYQICAVSGALHRIGVTNTHFHYDDFQGSLLIQ